MVKKICSKCKKPLDINKFGNLKISSDGLKSACKECLKLDAIKYKEDNKEKIVISCKKYKEDNKSIIKAKNKIYNDKEERKDWVREYLKSKCNYEPRIKKEIADGFKKCTHCGEILLAIPKHFGIDRRELRYGLTGICRKCRVLTNKKYKHYRNAKEKSLIATLSDEDWKECLLFFNNKDAYTGLSMGIISRDHVIPLSKGGCYVKQNIIPCDKFINSSKNKSDMETWYKHQPFYDEKRLNKIYKWIGFKNNIQQLKFI